LRALSKSSVLKLQLKTPNSSEKQQLCDNEFQTEGVRCRENINLLVEKSQSKNIQ